MINQTVWTVLLRYVRLLQVSCLLLALFFPGEMRAQNQSSAKIVGTVTDASGALVQNATVKITNIKTGTSTQVITNQKGAYEMPFLDPGSYTVEFTATGFDRVMREGIVLELDQIARVDTQLKIGSTRAGSGHGLWHNPPILNTDDSQRGTNFNSTLIANLPTVGRDPSYFALLAPGTSTAQSNVSGVDPGRRSVNGSRAFSISATVNGGNGVLPNSDNFVTLVPRSLGRW